MTVNKREGNAVHFSELNVGDCFIFYNNIIYMKTETINGCDNNEEEASYNAVNLAEGYMSAFRDDYLVRPVVGVFNYTE